jgi:UDP-N-acetylglucosamine--dolichyl-phosphate N-acetylglucosaminephosphotransferase
MELILLSCFALSFLLTIFVTPKWIKKMEEVGLVGNDMNRPEPRPKVAEPGGIVVIIGATFGILLYISIKTFYLSDPLGVVEIFAMLVTVLLAGMVGFIDDVVKILLRKRSAAESWRHWKVLYTVPIAIPLAVVNAGYSSMGLPFYGMVDFGFLFPLIIIPLGIIGATNGFNMMCGHSGLEAGMGVIILSTLGFVAFLSGSAWVAMLSLCIVSSLLAFLWYNKPPSSIFPGDSLTYAVGASIASIAILGNMEKIALVLFIPYMFDALMFVKYIIDRRRDPDVRLPEAFATHVHPDGSLEFRERLNGFEPFGYHIAKRFKKKVFERDWVLSILGVEALLAFAVVALWVNGLI